MSFFKKIAALLGFILMGNEIVHSQEIVPYFLNTTAGLPSNHVYHAIRDKNNYLWITTDAGIVKYNGYDLKFFGKESGLPTENVWFLYEDRKGRIWTSAVSSEIGYFYNDVYRKVVTRDSQKVIYPKNFSETAYGIHFININFDRQDYLSVERNDTIRSYKLPRAQAYHVNRDGLFIQKSNGFFRADERGRLSRAFGFGFDTLAYLCGKCLIPFSYGSTKINPTEICNIYTGEKVPLYLEDDENLYLLNLVGETSYITSNKHVYKVEPDMTVSKIASVDALLSSGQVKENDILIYAGDSFWGEWVTTQSRGILTHFTPKQFKTKNAADVLNIAYLSAKGHTSYLWNKENRVLLIEDKKVKKQIKLPQVHRIYKLIPYNDDSALVFSNKGIAWLDNSDSLKYLNPEYIHAITGVDGILYGKDKIYAVLTRQGLVEIDMTLSGVKARLIESERFSNIIYDSSRQTIVAYGRYNVYWKKGEQSNSIRIPENLIKIDRILFDSYGNVFLKTEEKLWMIDPENLSFQELSPQVNLKSAYFFIQGNRLVIIGKFGAAYYRINGKGSLSGPYMVYNFKNTEYSFISDAYLLPDGALRMHTDKGLLGIDPPQNYLFDEHSGKLAPSYNMVVIYGDSIYNSNESIELSILQDYPTLQFDLINPYGTGKVKYRYRLENFSQAWNYLKGNELTLPRLRPGKCYTLYLQATDDVLKTKVMELQLFVIPYWWQTGYGKTGIGAAILFLLASLSWAVVEITKRRVNQKNLRENLTLEVKNLNQALELKSIYAQLDPHFIFNTLNTGLYFIKKKKTEDAYEHFVSFSHLLRAYIKSSRNKFILLSEEVTNLGNYITLQQSRFDNQFDYEIVVAPDVGKKVRIPSLLLQPIVENAINHGLTHKQHGGKLLVEFRMMDGKDLVCIVDDNGIGRTKAKEFKEASKVTTTSYGTDLIKELIALLNKEAKVRIELEYIDKQPPLEGTTVIITIHNIYNAS